MAKAHPKIKFSYEDYKNLPESETRRYELLDGDLVMTPSPTSRHQSILRNLFKHLDAFVVQHQLGEVLFAPLDVVLGEDVVQPDLLFVSRERLAILQEKDVQGAPDLIVEILSPATADRDRTYKRTLYARHGVKEYWLVDSDNLSTEVLQLSKDGYQSAGFYQSNQSIRSILLPELAIPLSQIFK